MPMTTPMRRQYLEIKRQYPDAILFFRLGDFYETFDEDAKVVARACDIVLTARPISKLESIPMAGVPYHAADGYISRLIQQGYKVAIAEQIGDIGSFKRAGMTGDVSHIDDRVSLHDDVEDKSGKSGLMAREVVRLVTPGTIIEGGLLDEKRNNYLVVIWCEAQADRAGLAYADVSTGEFAAILIEGEDIPHHLAEEVGRLQPAEILMPDISISDNDAWSPIFSGSHVSPYAAWHFDLETASRALLEHFEVQTLEAFGLQGQPPTIKAAGALLQYLQETQKGSLAQMTSLRVYSPGGYMLLDAATRRNLELLEPLRGNRHSRDSLLGVLDETLSPMGGRLLRQWLNRPLVDIDQVTARHDAVQVLYDQSTIRVTLRRLLKESTDLERLINRVLARIAGPRDLLALSSGLQIVPQLKAILAELENPPTALCSLSLDGCLEITELIDAAISAGASAALGNPGIMTAGFSQELDEIHRASHSAREWIAGLEKRERERTGSKVLKVGYNKVFGYYLEISRSGLDRVPENYIRKQTLANAERYITPELKEYEAVILNADERIIEVETRLFREICSQIGSAAPRILSTARDMAELDVYASLADVALRNRYIRPVLQEECVLQISNGRHPVVELAFKDLPFVPNDIGMQPGEIIILTGPNMSGKSTYLRQTALIVLMAQIGSFVPAEKAEIGLVDRIFTRIGAQDELSAGQSTFMVEMVETAAILHQSSRRSLLILDEVGRGTSTYDGLAIARAVLEYIHNHPRLKARTLFATHYHELTELEKGLPRVHNYNVAVMEEGERVVFLHKILPGSADRSYGIHVARLAGIPRQVLIRADEILEELEKHTGLQTNKRRIRQVMQLSLFPGADPLRQELADLDVESLTPLEALNKLHELVQRAKREPEN
ncbi:MAG: DNA mismatch repair protein MutS [Chloroflexi bacterium]|nr:DNA mismatch repair protein MutS [Chloroflexota bacterium]